MLIIAKMGSVNCFLFNEKKELKEISTVTVLLSDFIFASAQLGWLDLYFTQKRKYSICCSIKEGYLKILVHIPELYMPHRSYFFNPAYIKSYTPKNYFPIMAEWEQVIPVARNKQKEFRQTFLNMGIQTVLTDVEIKKLHEQARLSAKTAIHWQF
jgi:hypothetical protein